MLSKKQEITKWLIYLLKNDMYNSNALWIISTLYDYWKQDENHD